MEDCIHCSRSKERQTKIKKETLEYNEEPGFRVAIDITGCNKSSLGGSQYASVKMNYGSGKLFVTFLKAKAELPEDVITFLKTIKAKDNKTPNYLRLDNSTENKKLGKILKLKTPELNLEFTARNTPQQNGRLERNIAIIWGLTRCLMDGAGLSKHLRGNLWCETFKTATDLINISATPKRDELRCELWNGKIPNYAKHLKRFGEIGVVKKGGLQSKLENKGIDCLFVGYADDHSGEVKRMMNLKTRKIFLTRDIKWLNMTYNKYKDKLNQEREERSGSTSDIRTIIEVQQEESKDSSESKENEIKNMETYSQNTTNVKIETIDDSSEDSDETKTPKVDYYRIKRELKQLNSDVDLPPPVEKTYNLRSRSNNQNIQDVDEELHTEFLELAYLMPLECIEKYWEDGEHTDDLDPYDELSELLGVEKGFYSALESDYKEPKNFRSMMKLPVNERNKWLKGVEEEIENIENREVWVRKKIKDIPPDRKLIGTKWVFK